jgi:esterase/lipase superfamily enzyme
VLARIVSFLIVIAAAAGVSHSQPAGSPGLPESCRTRPSQGLAALEKRKERLERAIARAREKPGKSAKKEDRSKTLTRSQKELLRVLFQIDCVKARQEMAKAELPIVGAPPPPSASRPVRELSPAAGPKLAPLAAPAPAPTAGPGPAPNRSLRKATAAKVNGTSNAIEVATYFATNRGRTGKTEPANAYDATVAALSYGRAIVSIPSTHTSGSLELPSIWKLQFHPDPKRHFVLKDAAPLSADDARAEMTKRLQEAKSGSLLIFVHGYNMSFAETAMRTAQLAYDLEFPGIPFFFSWPSAGHITGYLKDAESAQLSENAFDQVLDDLSQLPVSDVYIIAHSMGSRVVSQVLKARVDRGKPTRHLSELLLAAPDINADLFRTVIAPKLKTMHGTQTTVYASSSDLALRASKAVHGYPRVGETADGVFVFPGLETIDASGASMAVRAFGHSYLTDSAAVLKDIQAIVRQKLSAKERGLASVGASPNIYWSLH